MNARIFAPLLMLALACPAHAQETSAPPVARPEQFAIIDPKALKLLARVAEKYQRVGYYAGVSEVRYGDSAKPHAMRLRFSLAHGNTGIISKADERGSERWVSDGRVTRATATRRPKQYIEQPLNASGFWKIGREEFFERAGFQGILAKFLIGELGGLIVQPDLTLVSMEPTVENGATQKIVVAMASADKPDEGAVSLFIDSTLTLRRAMLREKVNQQPEMIWDETYTETVMSPEVPAGYYANFDVALPKDYKRVETFDPGPYAIPPVDGAGKAKTARPARTSSSTQQRAKK